MKPNSLTKLLLVVMTLLAVLCLGTRPSEAQIATTLHTFGSSGDGQYPVSALIMDSSGNLYGTANSGGANGYGTVFELVNSSGTYTENVLYSFTNLNGDGRYPYGTLVMDSSGNLYGTTGQGGANGFGTVFELVNSSGTYAENVLYSFTNASGDGAYPYSGVIMDSSGNLYGTTFQGGSKGYGTVFELVNTSGTYSEKTLYSFNAYPDGANPYYGGLVMDSAGNLYGTTAFGGYGLGTVFELVNSSGAYTEKLLYSFGKIGGDGSNPYSGVLMDSAGNLYGTTISGGNGYGTVFELVNSSGTYSEKILYSFTKTNGDGVSPVAGLIMDSAGNLYGTTANDANGSNGTVFELVNTSGTYSENVLLNFSGACTNVGKNPFASLVMDSSGNLYGTTEAGGAHGLGTVFSLSHFSGPTVSTTTTLASSANPVTAGDPVSFTATVAALSGVATTGTVTFSEGATTLGTQQVACGVATLPVEDPEALGIGTYSITAQYTPAAPVLAASSTSLNQTVNESGVVLTNGNNTLTGNQTINGTLNAASFFGDGSGLTNVMASGLNCTSCIGNMQLGINYAGSASQGGPAANALLFGGYPPSAFQAAGPYATTGANAFTGNQSITGNLNITGNSATTGTVTIGTSGTPIVEHLSATFNPSFPPLKGGCTSATVTFTGASDGDTLALGVPNARMTALKLFYTAWVSAADTVTIRACVLGVKPPNLGSGSIRVDVWKH